MIEYRQLIEGKLAEPVSTLWNAKYLPINQVISKGFKYGDKNMAYMPFIPYLVTLWDCKIVFLVRDGRDSVRSIMDWHDFRVHNIYTMLEDGEDTNILPKDEPWGYSYLRPFPIALYLSDGRLSRDRC